MITTTKPTDQLLEAYDSGDYESFFAEWRSDGDADLDFELQIHFCVHPLLSGQGDFDTAMSRFKEYIEIDDMLEKIPERYMPFLAMPFVKNVRGHKAFASVFQPEWHAQVKSKLMKALGDDQSDIIMTKYLKLKEEHNRVLDTTYKLVDLLTSVLEGNQPDMQLFQDICESLSKNNTSTRSTPASVRKHAIHERMDMRLVANTAHLNETTLTTSKQADHKQLITQRVHLTELSDDERLKFLRSLKKVRQVSSNDLSDICKCLMACDVSRDVILAGIQVLSNSAMTSSSDRELFEFAMSYFMKLDLPDEDDQVRTEIMESLLALMQNASIHFRLDSHSTPLIPVFLEKFTLLMETDDEYTLISVARVLLNICGCEQAKDIASSIGLEELLQHRLETISNEHVQRAFETVVACFQQ